MTTEMIYVGLSAADLFITVGCIKANKCSEANPLAKSHSSTAMIAVKAGLTVGHFLFTKELAERNPKAALRFAQISVGLQGGVVGINIVTLF